MRARQPLIRRATEEKGAILIQVGLCAIVLMGLSAFVLDFGQMWVARRQAQNAADAGALAGVNSLVNDDATWPAPAGGAVENSAVGAAQANTVLSVAPVVKVASACPPFLAAPNNTNCIQVDVYRNGQFSSPTLPTYFANLFGVTSQGVKATATAQVAAADTSSCLRPWMVPDKWEENTAPVDDFNGADRYEPATGNPISLTATGYRVPNDVGTLVTLKEGDPSGAISPSFYYEVVIKCKGGNCYRDAISMCADVAHSIGDTLETEPGNKKGPTKQGTNDLIDQDPSAYWNGTTVMNSSGPDMGSPRVVPIALFSPAEFVSLDRTSGRFDLTIVNILGFFVEGVNNQGDVTGRLVTDAGDLKSGGGPAPGPGGAFLKTVVLVR